MKNNNKNIPLIILGILISFVILELVFRIYYFTGNSSRSIIISSNPNLVFEHKRSISFINKYGVSMRFNSLGTIGDELKEEKTAIRILGIGDSITEAPYLEERDRYINKVAQELQSFYNKPFEVVNAAVSGYNSWQELELLKTKASQINPDLIILGITLNDSVSLHQPIKKRWFGGIAASIRDGSRARYFDFLYQKSDFYKFLYDRLAKSRKHIKGKEAFKNYLSEYKFNITDGNWLEWRKVLVNITETARARKIPILFVIFPLQNQVIRSHDFTFNKLSNLFENEKVFFIDLIDIFCNEYKEGRQPYLDYDMIHPSISGHESASRAISDFIIKNKILKNS